MSNTLKLTKIVCSSIVVEKGGAWGEAGLVTSRYVRSLVSKSFKARLHLIHECASESGFQTSSKWRVLMRIEALWRVYTIQLAHNLAAVHGEWHSVIVLYWEGKVQSCEGFLQEQFDRQHTNTSSLYREGFSEGRERHLALKRSGLSRKFLQSIPLRPFVSLAACQWRRGQSSPYPGEVSGVRQMEAITESSQQYGCSQDLLESYRLPRTIPLAQQGWHSANGRGELREGGPCQGPYIYHFLTCGGLLDNVVTPPHNHQTGSMRIKPPLNVDSFGTDFNSHSPNRFSCRHDESGFAPRLHLWMRINAH